MGGVGDSGKHGGWLGETRAERGMDRRKIRV